VQSLPLSRNELNAWHLGGVHVRSFAATVRAAEVTKIAGSSFHPPLNGMSL
jgi:hypothetical protein